MTTGVNQRQIISISLSSAQLRQLDRISKSDHKSRSQLIRELIDKYQTQKAWKQIRRWGKETAKKFNIKSEADILRIIND